MLIGLWMLLTAVHPIFAGMIVLTLIYFGVKAHKWKKEQERLRMEELAKPIGVENR